jgi:hypothetical protein
VKLSDLTDDQKTKLLAELDGKKPETCTCKIALRDSITGEHIPDYLTSYDSIIPLIQKLGGRTKRKVEDQIFDLECVYDATPRQLCDAVLVATGKEQP